MKLPGSASAVWIIVLVVLAGIGGLAVYKKISITNLGLPINQSSPQLLVLAVSGETNEKGEWIASKEEVYLIDPRTNSAKLLTRLPYEYVAFVDDHLLFRNRDSSQYSEYDFGKGEHRYLNFPKLENRGTLYQELSIDSPPLKDRDKLVLTVATYDSREESDFGGSPIKESENYLFSFSENSFNKITEADTEPREVGSAKELIRQRENLAEYEDELLDYSLLGFNDRDHKAIFQFHGEGGAGDVLIVDTKKNTLQKIETDVADRYVSSFHLSPSREKGFYAESYDDGMVMGRLVSLADIKEPLASIDLTEITKIPDGREDVLSVGWLDGESKIAAGLDSKIVIIDLRTKTIRTMWRDSTLGRSYTYWDRFNLETDSKRWIAFVDEYSAKYTECGPQGKKECPSPDEGDGREKVILFDLKDNTSNDFLDDGDYKSVIGWVNR